MRDIATATLSGNLTRDVELKQLPSGAEVARLRVASTARRRHGEEWVDKTNYFTVEVYGPQARCLCPVPCQGLARPRRRRARLARVDRPAAATSARRSRSGPARCCSRAVAPASMAGEDAGEQNGAAPDGAGQPGPEPVGVTSAEADTSASADDLPF